MDVTRTTTLLLEGLNAGKDSAWTEFDRRYRPILMGFLRAMGAGESNAADAAQETLLRFVKEYREGRYDRERGRLRNWMISMARSQLALDRRRASARREVGADPEALQEEAADARWDPDWDRVWEEERRRAILREAFTRLGAESQTGEKAMQAFELLVFRAVPVAAVARELDMSINDVYQAKSRVTARLRGHLEALEHAFDEDAV